MKIAFVAQPIDSVIPPKQNSIGIIIYEIARRLGKSSEVTIFLRGGRIKQKKINIENVTFILIPTGPDNRLNRFANWYLKYFKRKSPYYSSLLHFFVYALQIAVQLNRLKNDVIHVINFSQFIPIIRYFNPKAKIVIHMECEWLNQLNFDMIRNRIQKTDLIVGCSNFITKKIMNRFPEFEGTYDTIYNGVNISPNPGRKSDAVKSNNTIQLLFVGRVSPEKGVHILLNAFLKVLERKEDVKLTIIGPQSAAPAEYIVNVSDDPKVKKLTQYFSPGYQDRLEDKISAYLNKNVFFINGLPYKELVRYYFDTDIFVFPSVWHEPFGMPVIEAMACGKPVIATKSGGIPELIEDGRTGLLVDRDDSDGLADAILKLIDDDNLRISMGKAGRQRVLEKFTWDKVANDLLKLYQSIL